MIRTACSTKRPHSSKRDGLAKDNIGLGKKIDLLTRDKEALALAKEKLEKSLHDLSMVDVKMEKKRKKVK
jgi:hypothetical protein